MRQPGIGDGAFESAGVARGEVADGRLVSLVDYHRILAAAQRLGRTAGRGDVLQELPDRGLVVDHQVRLPAARDALLGPVLQRRQVDLARSEEHTSELQSLMRISYAV